MPNDFEGARAPHYGMKSFTPMNQAGAPMMRQPNTQPPMQQHIPSTGQSYGTRGGYQHPTFNQQRPMRGIDGGDFEGRFNDRDEGLGGGAPMQRTHRGEAPFNGGGYSRGTPNNGGQYASGNRGNSNARGSMGPSF